MAAEKAKRRIALALEMLRDLCRKAIDRAMAGPGLEIAARTVAVLAIETLALIRPEPPPRVVSAGDGPALFVIRC